MMNPVETVLTIARGLSDEQIEQVLDGLNDIQASRALNTPLIPVMQSVPKTRANPVVATKKGRLPIWFRAVDHVDWEKFKRSPNLRAVEGSFYPITRVKNVPEGTPVIVGMTRSDSRKELILIRRVCTSETVCLGAGSELFDELKTDVSVEGFELLAWAIDDDDSWHSIPAGDICREFPILQKVDGRASQHILYGLKRLGM